MREIISKLKFIFFKFQIRINFNYKRAYLKKISESIRNMSQSEWKKGPEVLVTVLVRIPGPQCTTLQTFKLIFLVVDRYNRLSAGSIPKSLSNCTMLEEFNIENNSVSALPDGLLAAVENLTFITISRNQVCVWLVWFKTVFQRPRSGPEISRGALCLVGLVVNPALTSTIVSIEFKIHSISS